MILIGRKLATNKGKAEGSAVEAAKVHQPLRLSRGVVKGLATLSRDMRNDGLWPCFYKSTPQPPASAAAGTCSSRLFALPRREVPLRTLFCFRALAPRDLQSFGKCSSCDFRLCLENCRAGAEHALEMEKLVGFLSKSVL